MANLQRPLPKIRFISITDISLVGDAAVMLSEQYIEEKVFTTPSQSQCDGASLVYMGEQLCCDTNFHSPCCVLTKLLLPSVVGYSIEMVLRT